MTLPRELTSAIVWLLDNLLPPLLRDSRWVMAPLLRLGLGPKAAHFERFRDNAANLSPDERTRFYEFLADAHIKRETDLSHACIERILSDVCGNSVLDVACGRGYLSRLLHAKQGRQVTGADFCPPLSEEIDPGLRFVKADIEALPFSDAAFDTVVCAHTLEHVLDIEQAVSELRRVGRQRLIIVLPCQRPYRFTFDLHLHFFPYDYSVRTLLRNPHGELVKIGAEWYYCEELPLQPAPATRHS